LPKRLKVECSFAPVVALDGPASIALAPNKDPVRAVSRQLGWL
jgi:hypothetical protein